MMNQDPIATYETNFVYDVFLSFRAEDTRYNITDYLSAALRQKGLNLIFSDDGLERSEEILPSVLNTIEKSRMSIVVLSQDYASSVFCLEELVKILDCKKTKNQRVWPIFYKVDPSDVRDQKNSYGEAMAKHEINYGNDSNKVQKWRSALSQVANLEGWTHNTGYGERLIQMIAESATMDVLHYDVFLCFTWDEINSTFISFLYDALRREGFETFMTDESFLDKAQISQSHTEAIKESKLSIIIFSENYAYSPSCLDQLVSIINAKKSNHHQVFPIFYKVKPSDVRYQTNSYGKAMAEYEEKCEKQFDKVQNWRSFLHQVANLKGWYLESGYEYKTIQNIVELVNKSFPRYDVFLSFKGQDTRYTFTGYLYNALCQKGIRTFMDDEALQGGNQISDTLIKAIEKAKLSIIVFS